MAQLGMFAGESIVRSPSEDVLRAALEAWEMVRSPFSPNTKKAYARAYARYGKWCDEAQVTPLPCSGAQLVTYLQWLTRQPGSSPSVVLQAASAISSIDRWSRVTAANDRPTPVTQSVVYERWYTEWCRQHGRRTKRKAPVFTRDQLTAIIRATHTPTAGAASGKPAAAWPLRSARDRALWLIAIAGAFRVSELAQMDVAHVERVPEGLVVFVPQSKTDQTGQGELVGIEPSSVHTLCPVRAWEAWLLERGDWSGAAWVQVARGGLPGDRLSIRSLQSIFTSTAARAGVRVTAHSVRRVFATVCARQRKPARSIMDHARWTRESTMREYVERANLFVDNPTRGLFEGDW